MSTAVEVVVLVVMVTAAVVLLIARTVTQRWAAMVAGFAAMAVGAWSHHDGPLWVAALAAVAVASLAMLISTRRTTSGKK